MLEAYDASKTKFSESDCAVKSVVPNSMFDPDERSVPEVTEPDKILIFKDERSASTMPSIFIEPEAPEESGANDINV